MDAKNNKFSKVRDEITANKKPEKYSNLPKNKKEKKEQMSIVLPPSLKKELRSMADSAGMSASELIAYWIESNKN